LTTARRIVAQRTRARGFAAPWTGALAAPASAWAAFFSYPRSRSVDIDPAWDETVDAMFRIQVTVGQTGDGKGVVCESDLLSPEVTARRA